MSKTIAVSGKNGINKFIILDEENYDEFVKYKWYSTKYGYIFRNEHYKENGIKKTKMLLIHRLVLPTTKEKFIDHINGNKLDNRLSNLRVCTKSENNRNTKLSCKNTTGYKGVSYLSNIKKYKTSIRINGKQYQHLFDTAEKAASAYNFYAEKYGGGFNKLNKTSLKFDRKEREPTHITKLQYKTGTYTYKFHIMVKGKVFTKYSTDYNKIINYRNTFYKQHNINQ